MSKYLEVSDLIRACILSGKEVNFRLIGKSMYGFVSPGHSKLLSEEEKQEVWTLTNLGLIAMDGDDYVAKQSFRSDLQNKTSLDPQHPTRGRLRRMEENLRNFFEDKQSDIPNRSREERIFDIAFNAVNSKEIEDLALETRLRTLQDYLLLKTEFFKNKGL